MQLIVFNYQMTEYNV